MAEYTKNLGLKKPDRTDKFSIEDFNANADIIDGITFSGGGNACNTTCEEYAKSAKESADKAAECKTEVENMLEYIENTYGPPVKFSTENLLLNVDFFDSQYASTVKENGKVVVTFHATENSAEWYSLTGAIDFNVKKRYKLVVNGWNGYGRLGISKRYTTSFSNDFQWSPFGDTDNSKAGTNATGNFYSDISAEGYVDGDNHVMRSDSTNDKIFRIVPDNYRDEVHKGSLWICTDKLSPDDTRDEFSVKMSLFEESEE